MSFRPLRRILNLRHETRNFSTTNAVRSGETWYYRTPPINHSKTTLFKAEAAGAVAWWWILWHIYSQPGHLFGEFDYPDPSKWTDEELGIPPDDFD